MELQFGVFGFLPTTHGNKCKQNAVHDIHAQFGISPTFTFRLKPQLDAGNKRTWWRTTVILNMRKTRTPQLEPRPEKKDGAGSGISVYIYVWYKEFLAWLHLNLPS